MSPVGLETMNHCAGEGHQQFSGRSVSQSICFVIEGKFKGLQNLNDILLNKIYFQTLKYKICYVQLR
jgi:hypothetical protein